MNLVNIKGGLGNQMFQYAFYLSLREKEKDTYLFVPFAQNDVEYGHQGYELQKLFCVENIVPPKYMLYFMLLKILHKRATVQKMRYVGCDILSAPKEFLFYEEKDLKRVQTKCYLLGNDTLYDGYWQSERFFCHVAKDVRQVFKFNLHLISSLTQRCEKDISKCNAVSIHIRRGDYLCDVYQGGFSKCVSIEYYKRAIDYICQVVKVPTFYVFSDDMNWVKDNLLIPSPIYVDWNKGEDSWQDMYLMSRCRHNIIANSTFSWWGAYLNTHVDKIVIAPKKWWFYLEKDDVVPSSWIRL